SSHAAIRSKLPALKSNPDTDTEIHAILPAVGVFIPQVQLLYLHDRCQEFVLASHQFRSALKLSKHADITTGRVVDWFEVAFDNSHISNAGSAVNFGLMAIA